MTFHLASDIGEVLDAALDAAGRPAVDDRGPTDPGRQVAA